MCGGGRAGVRAWGGAWVWGCVCGCVCACVCVCVCVCVCMRVTTLTVPGAAQEDPRPHRGRRSSSPQGEASSCANPRMPLVCVRIICVVLCSQHVSQMAPASSIGGCLLGLSPLVDEAAELAPQGAVELEDLDEGVAHELRRAAHGLTQVKARPASAGDAPSTPDAVARASRRLDDGN